MDLLVIWWITSMVWFMMNSRTSYIFSEINRINTKFCSLDKIFMSRLIIANAIFYRLMSCWYHFLLHNIRQSSQEKRKSFLIAHGACISSVAQCMRSKVTMIPSHNRSDRKSSIIRKNHSSKYRIKIGITRMKTNITSKNDWIVEYWCATRYTHNRLWIDICFVKRYSRVSQIHHTICRNNPNPKIPNTNLVENNYVDDYQKYIHAKRCQKGMHTKRIILIKENREKYTKKHPWRYHLNQFKRVESNNTNYLLDRNDSPEQERFKSRYVIHMW